MIKLSFGLLVISSVIIYGCKQSTTPPPSSAPIFPLTEGNSWSYQVSEYDSTNTLQISYPETVTVGKEQVIGGESWHIINNTHTTSGDTIWYTIRTDGLWKRQFISNAIPSSLYKTSLIYKFPTSANDTFSLATSNFPPTSPTRFFNLTFSTAENISVQAGSFSCIHYQSHVQSLDPASMKPLNDTISEQNYVCPGTGLIQSVQNFLRLSGGKFSRFRDETVLQSSSLH